jgi:hypothetical protein
MAALLFFVQKKNILPVITYTTKINMDLAGIAAARLISQQITAAKFTKTKDLIGYMGAVQAQDYAMAKWAIGLRLPGSTENQVEKALDKGEMLRTHVLRPTWHFVAASDIYSMLALTAGRIKVLAKTINRQSGLTEKDFTKSNAVMEKSLQGNRHLTREAIAVQLEAVKIFTGESRLSQLLMRAELESIICSGRMDRNKKTYALLEERVPVKKKFSKEESLALLAGKYFTSRGPATIEDFRWWSGLSVKDAKHALEISKKDFIAEKINEQTYWYSNVLQLPAKRKTVVHLLPAFDEYIISYKDRTATLAAAHHKKVLTINGIFNPVILIDGQAAGLWRKTIEQDTVFIETRLFQHQNKTVMRLIEKQASAYGEFSGRKTEWFYK